MSDQMKNTLKAVGGVLAIIALLFAVSRFAAVNIDGITTNAGGGAIAVVFDKASVMGADKIVAYVDDEVVTISDKDDVRLIASEFVVANRTALCESRSGDKLEIYNGGRLVRTVYWSDCSDDFAHIYQADATHWILGGDMGQVQLSKEAKERIDQIIEAHRQSDQMCG